MFRPMPFSDMPNPHPSVRRDLAGIRCIEQLPRIVIERLEAFDPLFLGRTPLTTVWRDGRPVGAAHIEVGDGRLHVRAVRLGCDVDRRLELDLLLHFHWMPAGGQRTRFVCPLCCRNARVLYFTGRVFCCRVCVALPYRQQLTTPIDRRSQLAARYRWRLGLGPFDSVDGAHRPAHMKRQTFTSLKRAIVRGEQRAYIAACAVALGVR